MRTLVRTSAVFCLLCGGNALAVMDVSKDTTEEDVLKSLGISADASNDNPVLQPDFSTNLVQKIFKSMPKIFAKNGLRVSNMKIPGTDMPLVAATGELEKQEKMLGKFAQTTEGAFYEEQDRGDEDPSHLEVSKQSHNSSPSWDSYTPSEPAGAWHGIVDFAQGNTASQPLPPNMVDKNKQYAALPLDNTVEKWPIGDSTVLSPKFPPIEKKRIVYPEPLAAKSPLPASDWPKKPMSTDFINDDDFFRHDLNKTDVAKTEPCSQQPTEPNQEADLMPLPPPPPSVEAMNSPAPCPMDDPYCEMKPVDKRPKKMAFKELPKPPEYKLEAAEFGNSAMPPPTLVMPAIPPAVTLTPLPIPIIKHPVPKKEEESDDLGPGPIEANGTSPVLPPDDPCSGSVKLKDSTRVTETGEWGEPYKRGPKPHKCKPATPIVDMPKDMPKEPMIMPPIQTQKELVNKPRKEAWFFGERMMDMPQREQPIGAIAPAGTTNGDAGPLNVTKPAEKKKELLDEWGKPPFKAVVLPHPDGTTAKIVKLQSIKPNTKAAPVKINTSEPQSDEWPMEAEHTEGGEMDTAVSLNAMSAQEDSKGGSMPAEPKSRSKPPVPQLVGAPPLEAADKKGFSVKIGYLADGLYPKVNEWGVNVEKPLTTAAKEEQAKEEWSDMNFNMVEGPDGIVPEQSAVKNPTRGPYAPVGGVEPLPVSAPKIAPMATKAAPTRPPKVMPTPKAVKRLEKSKRAKDNLVTSEFDVDMFWLPREEYLPSLGSKCAGQGAAATAMEAQQASPIDKSKWFAGTKEMSIVNLAQTEDTRASSLEHNRPLQLVTKKASPTHVNLDKEESKHVGMALQEVQEEAVLLSQPEEKTETAANKLRMVLQPLPTMWRVSVLHTQTTGGVRTTWQESWMQDRTNNRSRTDRLCCGQHCSGCGGAKPDHMRVDIKQYGMADRQYVLWSSSAADDLAEVAEPQWRIRCNQQLLSAHCDAILSGGIISKGDCLAAATTMHDMLDVDLSRQGWKQAMDVHRLPQVVLVDGMNTYKWDLHVTEVTPEYFAEYFQHAETGKPVRLRTQVMGATTDQYDFVNFDTSVETVPNFPLSFAPSALLAAGSFKQEDGWHC